MARYADKLARVADEALIDRMRAAGLSRPERKRLKRLARKGDLKGTDFAPWLIATFMATGDGAFS